LRFAFFFLNGDSGVQNFKHVCYGVCMVSVVCSVWEHYSSYSL